ncbi:MAG: DUF2961 domain-containing protein [Verrucomicrobiota bacterium]
MKMLGIGLVFAVCTSSSALASVGSMDYPERAVTRRESSYDRDWENGNADARILAAGETLTIAEMEGPGRITHIWFTSAGPERGYVRSVVIRMYWDGSDEPAVEVPLGDFFAAGHGMQVNVDSALVANSSFGRANNCYWPMPFRKSARITVTNESKTDGFGLYSYVDWEQRPVPEDAPYFHAQYRQENPPKQGEDYLIADIEGRGHYVGTVLSVRMSHPGWFGEGDDRFYVDGDTKPTIHGTGTEDYFNDAWAFRVVNRPNYGVSIWEGMNAGGRISAYRWHVTDPVFFEKSLKFTIEHKGNTFYEDGTLVDAYTDRRPDAYSSVAFWYQQGQAKRFAEMPPVEERMVPATLIQVDETLAGKLPEGVAVEAVDYAYSNGTGIVFRATDETDALEIPFEVAEDGRYVVFARVWPRGDTGIFDFYLDGTRVVRDEDLFREHHSMTDLKLGHNHQLSAGSHTIKAVSKGTGKRGGAKALFMDAIVLEPIPAFEKKPDEPDSPTGF